MSTCERSGWIGIYLFTSCYMMLGTLPRLSHVIITSWLRRLCARVSAATRLSSPFDIKKLADMTLQRQRTHSYRAFSILETYIICSHRNRKQDAEHSSPPEHCHTRSTPF